MTGQPKIRVIRGTDVSQGEPIRWVWAPYIPAGRITIMDGDPGLGKSFLALDIAARISSGQKLPDGQENENGPQNVIICNSEDEYNTTLVPRLKAAGAQFSRLLFCDQVGNNGSRRSLYLPDDQQLLAELIKANEVKLVVLDPIMSFLGQSVRTNSDQSVRAALHCLNIIGADTGAAFLLVRHLNKGGGTKAIYRGGGSIGIIGLARSGLLVAKHPDQPGKTLLLHAKSNLAKKGPTLSFVLNFRKTVGAVKWRGVEDITADQALKEFDEPTELERAQRFLRAALADGREALVTDLIAEAKSQRISPASLVRASKSMTIFKRKKTGARHGRWQWSLKPPAPGIGEFLESLPHV